VSIDPAASIARVHLTIPDLNRSVAFYRDRIGLQVHRQSGAMAALGAGASDLLVLHESPSAPRVRRTTGLYHFAILVPSRPDLARALRHLGETATPMQGFADHFVSEALYLADPDGNGIELYRDRPRGEWPMNNGVLQMGSDPLDLENLLGDAGPAGSWIGMPAGTVIGHVHLHVADIAPAERFYAEGLGLDLMQRYGGTASFLSAGGYHHHVAINTWAGVGAPAPPPGAIGLKHVVIRVSNDAALADVAQSLTKAGFAHESADGHVMTTDPSGNVVVVTRL
jgi:catechol 2,3-dioxygenase